MNGMSNTQQFGYQVPTSVGPDFTIPGQQRDFLPPTSSQGFPQGSHPALFGENQFKNGFGPVYATPTYPWQHGQNPQTGTSSEHQNHEQIMSNGHWQQVGSSPPAMPVYYMVPYCLCPSFAQGQWQGSHQ